MTMRNPYLHLASNHGYTTDKKEGKKKKWRSQTTESNGVELMIMTRKRKMHIKNAEHSLLRQSSRTSHRDPKEKKNYSI